MTIAFRAGSGMNDSSGGGPSFPAPSTPVATQADDFRMAILAIKAYSFDVASGTFLSFGEQLTNHADGTVNPSGSGTGSVRLHVRGGRNGSASSLTTSLSSAGTPSGLVGASFSKSNPDATWDAIATDADDYDDSGTTIVSTGVDTLDIRAGDMLVWIMAGRDDFTTPGPEITVPGCTLEALGLVNNTTVTTLQNDLCMRVYYTSVASGVASGPPTATNTSSISGKSGVTATFVRLRELVPSTGYSGWGIKL